MMEAFWKDEQLSMVLQFIQMQMQTSVHAIITKQYDYHTDYSWVKPNYDPVLLTMALSKGT